jgi:signal transduction histidine kinase
MDSLGWGIALGITIAGAIALAFGVWAYWRFVRLERRTRRAERLAELGTLTAGLAHEIKNPLSTIQLNLALLAEDLQAIDSTSPRSRKRLGTLQQEAARLRDILDDFLRYAGRLELERSDVDLVGILEDLVDFFAPQASINNVRLRLDVPDEAVKASVDAKLIKQAMLNLMLNATQAMTVPRPDGSTGGELMLSVRSIGNTAQIKITDTGPGIPEDKQSEIFQAYYTTRKGGTGLGLPMTRRIIEEHGGKITLVSELGKGTAFTITLPITR